MQSVVIYITTMHSCVPAAVAVIHYVQGRKVVLASVEYMDRLRTRKHEVGQQIEKTRSAQRFEPPPQAPVEAGVLQETARPSPLAKGGIGGGARPSVAPEKPQEQESYTSRLLKAKQRVWQDRET
ncbi:MAG: hypothetical protein HY000_20840 [Planctomycetes bacterium]|nr:hypothetical protein [Planctomycetota bacterium]